MKESLRRGQSGIDEVGTFNGQICKMLKFSDVMGLDVCDQRTIDIQKGQIGQYVQFIQLEETLLKVSQK